MGAAGLRSIQAVERKAVLVAGDAAMLTVSVALALARWATWDPAALGPLSSWLPWFLFLPSWGLVMSIVGCYDLRLSSRSWSIVKAIFVSTGLILTLYVILYFLAPPESLPRAVVLIQSGLALVLLIAWRVFIARAFRGAVFQRKVLIVGAGSTGFEIVDVIHAHGGHIYRVVGCIDDDPARRGTTVGDVEVLGSSEDLVALVLTHRVAEIVVAIRNDLRPELLAALLSVQEQAVQITPMTLMYERLTGQVPVRYVGDDWYVSLPLSHRQISVGYATLKRAIDLGIALVGLVIFSALLPLIALAVKIDSRGPVFYKQTRIGRNGRPFELVKVRTMVRDAETAGQPVWASQRDSRVTKVGAFLRAAMLDELPQLWNVLKGEMSIVGPRPERPGLVEMLEKEIPYYRLRHAVTPGMAGWAFLHLGYTASVEAALEKIQYDLFYIKRQSLWLDLQILIRTIGRGLTGRRRERRGRAVPGTSELPVPPASEN